jgi:PadR family transcriptional regulator PadR
MSKESKSDLLPGTLGMLILRTLRRGSLHGYGIAQHIQQISEDALRVEEGSLYPALQRLELQGWVVSEWGETAKNRRARMYQLTPAGRKQLQRETAAFKRILAGIARVMGSA